MAYTIAKMLQLPPFHNARVLAGNKGLNCTISGVTMLESTTFSTSPLQSMRGEIVLTSPFFLNYFYEKEINYILECHKRQAAGICIKADSSSLELPANIISVAERLDFPVVVLQSDKNFAHLITLISYEILHWEGYDHHLSYEENFFQELISSRQDRDTFFKRGAMLGLGQDEVLCALLIHPSDDAIAEQICEFCRNQWEHKCYTLTKNARVMVALRLTVSEVDKALIISIAEDLMEKLQKAFPPHTFRVGIGRCYKEVSDFNKSFLEACSALSFNMIAHSREPVSHFNNLGVYRILFDYKNREELFQLYQDTVGIIAEYDRKNQTEYLTTIRTYFSQNYSINNTAKKLFVHYNTILYRLNKIKTLFGMDLNNEEDRINLYVSIRAADSQNLWKTF